MNAATHRRVVLMALAIAVFIGMEWGRTTLRPWARRTGLGDPGLIDSAGVLGAVAVVLFLALALSSAQRRLPLLRAAGVGAVALAYVFLRPYFGAAAFAWNDVLAAAIGFAAALLAGWLVWKWVPDTQ